MKRILLNFILAISLSTMATSCVAGPRFWGGHHGWYHGGVRGGWWGPGPILAGVVIGGVIMYDIDVNAQPYPGYERRVVCTPWTYMDQWGRQVTEQQCHIEWIRVY